MAEAKNGGEKIQQDHYDSAAQHKVDMLVNNLSSNLYYEFAKVFRSYNPDDKTL